MIYLYRAIKYAIVSALTLLLIVYAVAYVLLKIPSIQQNIKSVAISELSNLLHTDVTIGNMNVEPFNKIVMQNLCIFDQQGDTLVYANRLGAGVRLSALLTGQLHITNIQLFGGDVRITQTEHKAPTNLQFILDAFAKDTTSTPIDIDYQINAVVIRRGKISFNVLSEPLGEPGVFDPNHIAITNFLTTLSMRTLSKDSINANIKRLSFEEQSGLSLQKLSFHLLANQNKGTINNFELRLPHSVLAFEQATVDMSNVSSAAHFADSAMFYLNLPYSKIVLSDLAPLIPPLKSFDLPAFLSCEIEGTPNALSAKNLRITTGDGLYLHAKAMLNNFFDPQNSYLYGQVKELSVTSSELSNVIDNITGQRNSSAQLLNKLGKIKFNGEISGFLSNLVAFGTFSTEKRGSINTDIMLNNNKDKGVLNYSGRVETRHFDFSNFFDPSIKLKEVALQIDVDGYLQDGMVPHLKIKGNVAQLNINDYIYHNIKLNSVKNGTSYTGKLEITDTNGKLSIDGLVDLKHQAPLFRFVSRADSIRLNNLHLINKYKDSSLSFLLSANFDGNSIDNLDGDIAIDSIYFSNSNGNIFIDRIELLAKQQQESVRSIELFSPIVSGKIKGNYAFSSFITTINNFLLVAMPTVATPSKNANELDNNFDFNFIVNANSELSKIFELPIVLNQELSLDGFFSDRSERFKVLLSAPSLNFNKMLMEETSFLAEKRNESIDIQLHSTAVNPKGRMVFGVRSKAHNDVLNTRIFWSNTALATYSGDIASTTTFERTTPLAPLATRINIEKSSIYINDSLWNIPPATVLLDSGKIKIDDFEVRHKEQYLSINGIISKEPSHQTQLVLNDINLDYLFSTLNIPNVTFGGDATGIFHISNLYTIPNLNTKRLSVKNFSYNSVVLGDLYLRSAWENDTQGILMQGGIKQADLPDTFIDGHIYPTKDSMSIAFDATKLKIDFLQPFLESVAKNVHGYAYGNVRLYGRFSDLNIVGKVFAHDLNFTIEPINVTYNISDSVHFTTNTIQFKDINIFDSQSNTAQASGIIQHEHLRNMRYDIQIFNARNFQVFNLTEKLNPSYYGTVYGTGVGSIVGDEQRTSIGVNMRTDANSNLTYALSSVSTASDYQFISFVEKPKARNDLQLEVPGIATTTPIAKSNLFLDLQIDVTPNATMQLIMDPNTGDLIKAHGNGNIRLEYNSVSDEVSMFGNYTLDKGNYNFHMQDFISRDFQIKTGSRIAFRGDPMQADLNIQAIYATSADLRDLDETIAEQKEITRTYIPVHTVLNIAGDLRRPDLSFDLAFPTLSEDLIRRVKGIISTEDMMNRQIIYLLVMGKFYTPDYMNMGTRNSNELASVVSSTLSSQLNNMLSQISDNWNVGTTFRSDKGDFSDIEAQVALSSQLLNNRLLLNGNFGYRNNTMANTSFIGDFDLEYLLIPSGNLRLKAYSHYNDRNYTFKSSLTTQGVGFVLKHDFKKLSDLWRRKPAQKLLSPSLSEPTNTN